MLKSTSKKPCQGRVRQNSASSNLKSTKNKNNNEVDSMNIKSVTMKNKTRFKVKKKQEKQYM